MATVTSGSKLCNLNDRQNVCCVHKVRFKTLLRLVERSIYIYTICVYVYAAMETLEQIKKSSHRYSLCVNETRR